MCFLSLQRFCSFNSIVEDNVACLQNLMQSFGLSVSFFVRACTQACCALSNCSFSYAFKSEQQLCICYFVFSLFFVLAALLSPDLLIPGLICWIATFWLRFFKWRLGLNWGVVDLHEEPYCAVMFCKSCSFVLLHFGCPAVWIFGSVSM